MIDISQEAMQAVLQSKLGKELDALWQEVIDYRDKSCADLNFRNKRFAICKFFEKTTIPKLKECVWKHVGLHFSDVKIDNGSGHSFCTWMYFDKTNSDKQDGTLQIESILNADYIFRSSPILKMMYLSAEDIMTIAKSYDKTIGGIKASAKVKIREMVRSQLGFDIDMGFLMADMVSSHAEVGYFTARELTAIILHEIGHTLTLIEHAADGFARISTFKYLESAFTKANANNIDEVSKLADAVASDIRSSGNPKLADQLVAVTEKLKSDIGKCNNSCDEKHKSNAVLGLIGAIFGFMLSMVIYNLGGDIIFGNQQSKRFIGTKEQKTKVGDIPVNARLNTWMERKADEYALTHGYGADQATALHRLQKFLDRYMLSDKQCDKLNKIERLHKSLGLFKRLGLLLLAPTLADSYPMSIYPLGVQRLRELLNISIQQLKANSTNAAYITKYMKDCDTIIQCMDNGSVRDEYMSKLYKSYDIFIKYISLPSFIDWLVNGRVKRELEDLINDVDAIGNSLLTYYGYKIGSTASK